MNHPRDQPYDPHKIYIYLCVDGITRQRCGRHIHTEPSLAPDWIYMEMPVGKKTCIECFYESLAHKKG
ncbi:MAG: hypothetical protein DCC55_25705 [Chloroflexi bacterium]|nr:MAG: hypothetical protein DCC55_25705 [Chloroflexota bacterium]